MCLRKHFWFANKKTPLRACSPNRNKLVQCVSWTGEQDTDDIRVTPLMCKSTFASFSLPSCFGLHGVSAHQFLCLAMALSSLSLFCANKWLLDGDIWRLNAFPATKRTKLAVLCNTVRNTSVTDVHTNNSQSGSYSPPPPPPLLEKNT